MTMDISVVKKAYAFLDLEMHIVGSKLIYDEKEYERAEGIELQNPIAYCQAVRAACSGNRVKLNRATCGCQGSRRSLGFERAPEDYYIGKHGERLGLYETREIAKKVANNLCICTRPLIGTQTMPLEDFKEEPDVAIIVCNTREAMRVIQGYTSTYGIEDRFTFTGNQAVCVECTTLLRSIAGLVPVDSGKILIDGTDVTGMTPKQRNLAMIFQQPSLFPTMTVFDNIAFGLKLKKCRDSRSGKRFWMHCPSSIWKDMKKSSLPNFREENCRESRWRDVLSPIRRFCCSMNRSVRSMQSCANLFRSR